MGPHSELVTAQATVHGDHGAGNVARQRGGQEAHEVGDVLGLAIAANRDLVLRLPLPVFRRVVAADLLGHDAAGGNAVDRDAVLADLARKTFRPGVHGGLGGESPIYAVGLGLARHGDDATPLGADHLADELVRELA